MDVTIPGILRGLISQLLGVLGTIVIICYANVYFIAVIIPLGVVFYFVQKFYVATARQVYHSSIYFFSNFYPLCYEMME